MNFEKNKDTTIEAVGEDCLKHIDSVSVTKFFKQHMVIHDATQRLSFSNQLAFPRYSILLRLVFRKMQVKTVKKSCERDVISVTAYPMFL